MPCRTSVASVLQVCCRVLQDFAGCCRMLQCCATVVLPHCTSVVGVLQCVAGVLQGGAVLQACCKGGGDSLQAP